jgi:hypothetical protein
MKITDHWQLHKLPESFVARFPIEKEPCTVAEWALIEAAAQEMRIRTIRTMEGS